MSRTPEEDEKLVTEGLAAKAKRTVGKVPFARDAVAAYFCARDPATPTHVKAAIMGALAYFIMPMDVVPDFIAALGYTDDATIFYAAWRLLAPHLKDDHRIKAEAFLGVDGPTLDP